MKLTVRYFAAFRDAVGLELEEVRTEARTPQALFAEAAKRHGGLAHEPAALVAVNDAMSDWDVELHDGDEVLFFPPVAGG